MSLSFNLVALTLREPFGSLGYFHSGQLWSKYTEGLLNFRKKIEGRALFRSSGKFPVTASLGDQRKTCGKYSGNMQTSRSNRLLWFWFFAHQFVHRLQAAVILCVCPAAACRPVQHAELLSRCAAPVGPTFLHEQLAACPSRWAHRHTHKMCFEEKPLLLI